MEQTLGPRHFQKKTVAPSCFLNIYSMVVKSSKMPTFRLMIALLVLSLLAVDEAAPYLPGYMMGGRRGGFMRGPMRGPMMGGPMRRHGMGRPIMGRYGRMGGFGMGGRGMRPVPF
nr:unnamed protein product [Haemonchus contortus]